MVGKSVIAESSVWYGVRYEFGMVLFLNYIFYLQENHTNIPKFLLKKYIIHKNTHMDVQQEKNKNVYYRNFWKFLQYAHFWYAGDQKIGKNGLYSIICEYKSFPPTETANLGMLEQTFSRVLHY